MLVGEKRLHPHQVIGWTEKPIEINLIFILYIIAAGYNILFVAKLAYILKRLCIMSILINIIFGIWIGEDEKLNIHIDVISTSIKKMGFFFKCLKCVYLYN